MANEVTLIDLQIWQRRALRSKARILALEDFIRRTRTQFGQSALLEEANRLLAEGKDEESSIATVGGEGRES